MDDQTTWAYGCCMTQDRPMLGITLMIGFCLTIPFSDAAAKLASASLPILVLVLARMAFQAVAMTGMAQLTGRSLGLTRRAKCLIAARSALNLVGLSAIFVSFRFLPLADAIAIAYVMPFILFFLGHYFMGEEIGWRRVVAALLGFLGTLLVIQPSFAEVGVAALLPVVAAFVFAVYILVTRVVSRVAESTAIQAATGWYSVGLLIPAAGLGTWLGLADLQLATPTPTEWAYLAGIGLFGTVGHLLMVQSLANAPAATVAPVQYLEIPVAAVLGFFLFDEFPNGLALAGIALILAAGLYILWRERVVSRVEGPPKAGPAPQTEG